MTIAWLTLNALLYLALGVWCTLNPAGTATAIGYDLTNGSARSEYLTVYGGLEIGMAAFFAICAWRPDLRQAGLLFGVLSYGGIVLWRAITAFTMAEAGSFPRIMLPIEGLLFASALFLYLRRA